MNTDERIRASLKAAMLEQNLNQNQLAERLEISQQAVSAMVRGAKGKIPPSLTQMLDAVGLELVAVEAHRE